VEPTEEPVLSTADLDWTTPERVMFKISDNYNQDVVILHGIDTGDRYHSED
jgi:hypothetical protein